MELTKLEASVLAYVRECQPVSRGIVMACAKAPAGTRDPVAAIGRALDSLVTKNLLWRSQEDHTYHGVQESKTTEGEYFYVISGAGNVSAYVKADVDAKIKEFRAKLTELEDDNDLSYDQQRGIAIAERAFNEVFDV